MSQANPEPSPLDLPHCDREPIRTPGSIQPHGFLLALSPTLDVLQASDNLEQMIGADAARAIGQPLERVIGEQASLQLRPELDAADIGQRPLYLCTLGIGPARHFDVLAHCYDGLLIVEFEAVDRASAADLRHLHRQVGDFLLKVGDSAAAPAMCELAAREIRRVTGFGRVMVYQFDEEGHGHVLAECRDDAYPSYLGQRFPASDIPRQARELYMLNRIRLIQDANYTPARLVPPLNPVTGAPNDLSFAALRSVSPIHLQYMRNMGTMASMSVSLMVKGRLWGLISCHHATPCALAFDKRTACEQLGQILAMCVESREDANELQFRLDVRRIMVSMLAGLTQSSDFIDNLSSVFPALLQFARAGGAAIVFDERLLTYGDTPDEEAIRALVGWLDLRCHGDVFHTDHLAAQYPPAAALSGNAAGLLAMPVSRIHKHYLLWFRPEVVRTVEWAGNPHAKDGAAPMAQLSPRTSFATWRETITGTSAAWHPGEIELATEFRTALLGIALERAEQMAELAEELGRANKELEAFSYSVSHDLRAPLRHIVGFSDLLLEPSASENPEKRQRFLRNIKDSARLAGKLVDDLLSFSQMGRAALRPTQTQMGELVRSCIDKLTLDVGQRQVEWDIGPLPAMQADPSFLQLALYNLLSNALKFTSQKQRAVITIRASDDGPEWVLSIADNGAGFNMDYVHKLFGVFQRLHRMEDFQGTGIGLANVRRIIERHGGRVWASGVPGEGATFYFSIPKERHMQGT
ncbi:ATP-binding protein [Massilia antarctica]|uniref:ATP-binding protein n=1 Tax=Massilia antarctica TaxID=2765360 RepID=UPI0006BB7318|nr:ATP-binding protein [Massilia sp. H27-R4]MCY0913790.1 ATP-binding protein [Massilia sp. H27-R4]CUI04487.1 Phytochrome, two-component sensor histidine kinase [Janthinobacterium sp. CG23_2]CUU28273.1 Phytochrome, two-component sensor histidine kinase [Janthinobacterium sp. CG23_2]